MDSSIAAILIQDGLTNGMIYTMLGIALVLAFSLTRVILLFVGEFVGFAALTFNALQQNQAPGVIGLVLLLGCAATVLRLIRMRKSLGRKQVVWTVLAGAGYSVTVVGLASFAAPLALPVAVDVVLTLVLVVPIAGYVYVLAYEPIQDASILTLLITAVGVHLILMTLGLIFFGPDGARSPLLVGGAIDVAGLRFTWQTIFTYIATVVILGALFVFFEKTLLGAAMRATAVNRLGARLVGIPTYISGQFAFLVAAFVAALCGLLIGPMTTIYYDTGFVIALKGFVAAVLGGLLSYPITAIAALGIAQLESFTAFFASQYKDAIVFAVILPVLLLRSLLTPHREGEE